jgi:hypothetical protein
MQILRNTAFIFATLLAPAAITTTALHADDHVRTYHDAQRNDDHHWDKREDRAYRIWVKQNHRRYSSFNRLRENDQQSYWSWRHEHPDAQLNINIR